VRVGQVVHVASVFGQVRGGEHQDGCGRGAGGVAHWPAWRWHGPTPTILFIKSKSTKSTWSSGIFREVFRCAPGKSDTIFLNQNQKLVFKCGL